jgi:hypothetical protein
MGLEEGKVCGARGTDATTNAWAPTTTRRHHPPPSVSVTTVHAHSVLATMKQGVDEPMPMQHLRRHRNPAPRRTALPKLRATHLWHSHARQSRKSPKAIDIEIIAQDPQRSLTTTPCERYQWPAIARSRIPTREESLDVTANRPEAFGLEAKGFQEHDIFLEWYVSAVSQEGWKLTFVSLYDKPHPV